MAAAPKSTVRALSEESTCPICLDYFRDPVIITECGHNFCRACLSQSGGESDAQASCPQCRGTFQKTNLRPNRQLAMIVEIAQTLRGQGVKGDEGKVQLCETHQEPLKLFCKDHEALICLVCDKAKEHEGHKVIPLEEASQEYQDLLQRRLESLRDERGRILACKAEAEREKQALLEQTKAEWEETVAQFRRLHHFLEEQQKRLLAQVDELQEEIARKAEDHLAWLSKELSSLEGIMREVEEKSRQPAAELLQDVRSTLQRSEKEPCEIPAAFPLELKRRIWYFSDRKPDLEGWRKQFL
uniref:Zinc finger protein RFP-like n=2 Tax=Varanus komodoensis TaxID=61221 RepID=A0A8D2JGP9_VARKO